MLTTNATPDDMITIIKNNLSSADPDVPLFLTLSGAETRFDFLADHFQSYHEKTNDQIKNDSPLTFEACFYGYCFFMPLKMDPSSCILYCSTAALNLKYQKILRALDDYAERVSKTPVIKTVADANDSNYPISTTLATTTDS